MPNMKPNERKRNKFALRSGKYPDSHVISFPTAQTPGARPPVINNLAPLLVRAKPRVTCMSLEQGRFYTRARLPHEDE